MKGPLLLSCIAAVLIAGSVSVRSQTPPNPDANTYAQHTALAIQSLQTWYDLDTGLYKTTGWWNSANAITTLADYARIAPTRDYNYVFSNTLALAQKTSPDFINRYYDDEGWWALAWIDVYGITRDPRYLEAAKSIFIDMTYGWDSTCSGGIWWSKDRKYKNAIANELFLSVAAHLANATGSAQERSTYLAWANREWTWFSHSGMINHDHLVNDGLTSDCKNNLQTTWTYNQGVILGGLAALHQANRNPAIVIEAKSIAEAAISKLTDAQGILHDTCEPKCGADGTQFKGIFVRNLRALNEAAPQPQYSSFILTNASSIWTQTHPPDYHLGEVWSAPNTTADASTQSSALDALVAATQISKSPKR